MEHDRDTRIRKRAHEIWEQEGRPDGKEAEHWERAERETSAADLPPLANTAVKKRASAKANAVKAGDAGKSRTGAGKKAPAKNS